MHVDVHVNDDDEDSQDRNWIKKKSIIEMLVKIERFYFVSDRCNVKKHRIAEFTFVLSLNLGRDHGISSRW